MPSSGIEKAADRQGWRVISVTHTTSRIHNGPSRSSPVLTHFSLTTRTSPVLTRFSLLNFTTVPPSCSLSSLTHALRSVSSLRNQTPVLVSVSSRPFDVSLVLFVPYVIPTCPLHSASYCEVEPSLSWSSTLQHTVRSYFVKVSYP